jgi:hypothetical protein
VELDLKTGRTRTIFEHKDAALRLLDEQDGVLLHAEFDGRGPARMIGVAADSGKVLWSLNSSELTWRHFFFNHRPSEPGDPALDFPLHNFSKPPAGADAPFCGLAGDRLAGIAPQTGRVLWQIEPPWHYANMFAWQCLFVLRNHVAAARQGGLILVDRADGKIVLELKPETKASFYQMARPIETEEHIVLAFDTGSGRQLVRWNKRSGELEQRTRPGVSALSVLAATEELVMTNENGAVIARDMGDFDRVVWRSNDSAWFDPGARALVWNGYLVTRSETKPPIDVRDGSNRALFSRPQDGTAFYRSNPWTVQNDTLYAVSHAGIVALGKELLDSDEATLPKRFWEPSHELGDSRRAPAFVDCLMGDGKAYLVLVHKWEPVFR